MFGMKPYDKTIGPVENMTVSVLAMGEGFHNYHHTFPYDYSTSEYGLKFNVTTAFINFMAKIGPSRVTFKKQDDSFLISGQAYDLRRPSEETVRARILRTGDPNLTKIGQMSSNVHQGKSA